MIMENTILSSVQSVLCNHDEQYHSRRVVLRIHETVIFRGVSVMKAVEVWKINIRNLNSISTSRKCSFPTSRIALTHSLRKFYSLSTGIFCKSWNWKLSSITWHHLFRENWRFYFYKTLEGSFLTKTMCSCNTGKK